MLLFLCGCNSTPKRDDYVKYIHNQKIAIDESDFKFTLSSPNEFDIRGVYDRDSSITNPDVLYAADAGLAGLLVQVAAHAATSSTIQSNKLAGLQSEANEKVSEFITLTNGFKNKDFIKDLEAAYTEDLSQSPVTIKPIFFVSQNMDQVAVKAQVWISETRKNKTTFKYKNLIAVTSKKITETQRNEIFQAGSDELKKVFTNLLTGVVELAKSEVILKFKNNNTPILSHIVYVNGEEKLIRGKVVEQNCQSTTYQNLRKWLLKFANESLREAPAHCEKQQQLVL